jgi:hypothetical protein
MRPAMQALQHTCAKLLQHAQVTRTLQVFALSACPSTAGLVLTCTLTVANVGNVRLGNITVGGNAVNCGMAHPALLSPGSNFTCTMLSLVVQDNFEVGSINLAFPATAGAMGQIKTLIAPLPAAAYAVPLPQLPQLDLVTSMDPKFVTWPGERSCRRCVGIIIAQVCDLHLCLLFGT